MKFIQIRTVTFLTSLALLGAASLLPAALVSYESFDYAPGQFSTGHLPNSGWNSAWSVNSASPNPTIISSSLSAPNAGHASTGGHLAVTTPGSGIGISASIAYGTGFQYNMSQEGTVRYASMLVNKSSIASSGSEYIQLNIGAEGGRTNWLMGMSSSESFFLRSHDTESRTSFSSGSPVQANQDYLMVSKLVTSATGNDVIYLNWYKGTDLVPKDEPVNWMFQMSLKNGSSTTSTNLLLESGNSANTTFRMDEIRLGTTWAAVAPEPTKGLLALVALGCLGMRRSRRLAL